MKYQVKDPQGQTHIIDGPEGASPEEVIAQAQKLIPAQQPKQFPGSFQEIRGLANSNQSTGRKLWEGLKIPEQMSERGLQGIANAIPEGKITGNLPMDMLRGAPKIAANTMAQAAPGFVSRGSMIGAAAAPAIGAGFKAMAPAGRSVATALEDWSGIKPGALSMATKDPSLIFAKGTGAAKPYYQAGQAILRSSKIIGDSPTTMGLVRKAADAAEAGTLLPEEADEARKAVSSLYRNKNINRGWLDKMKSTFDKVALQSGNISEGASVHQRGLMAESLRGFVPRNVGGRGSPFKVAEGVALSHLGPLGKVAGLMFSPIVQGAAATGLGVGSRVASDPAGLVTALNVLRRMRNNENPNP